MIDLKNVLDVVNEGVVLSIVILTFFLLIYIVYYLSTRDPDIIRSRIFLKYEEFKKAFILLAAFGLMLILHVGFIYLPRYFNFYDYPVLMDLQKLFGLVLSLIMITFVYVLIKSISKSNIDNLTEQ
ncbi:MAG: hypothetical protein Q8M95_10045 [Candidatus Methanoperedens sp.]|nr:hypothetical protein [Candidatus Methanoperedens sp.]